MKNVSQCFNIALPHYKLPQTVCETAGLSAVRVITMTEKRDSGALGLFGISLDNRFTKTAYTWHVTDLKGGEKRERGRETLKSHNWDSSLMIRDSDQFWSSEEMPLFNILPFSRQQVGIPEERRQGCSWSMPLILTMCSTLTALPERQKGCWYFSSLP